MSKFVKFVIGGVKLIKLRVAIVVGSGGGTKAQRRQRQAK